MVPDTVPYTPLVLVMGVRLTSRWTAGAFRGLLSLPRWGWVKGRMNEWDNYFLNFRKSGAHGGMVLTGENRKSRRKACPSVILSTTNPTGLTWARTHATAVRGWRLTAWAMARSYTPLNHDSFNNPTFHFHSPPYFIVTDSLSPYTPQVLFRKFISNVLSLASYIFWMSHFSDPYVQILSLTVLYALILVFLVTLSLCNRKLWVMITTFLEGFKLGFLVGRFIGLT
jgi:hypothetical protein